MEEEEEEPVPDYDEPEPDYDEPDYDEPDDDLEQINEVEDKEMSFADEIIDESDGGGMRAHFGKDPNDIEDDDDWANMEEGQEDFDDDEAEAEEE